MLLGGIPSSGWALPSGLIGYWAGDGNFLDGSGNANHGVSVPSGEVGFGVGKVGQAFALDGANDQVQVPDSALWTLGSSDFTIDLWVNFDSVRLGPLSQLPNVFVGHDQGGGVQPKWVFYQGNTSQIAFHVNTGGTQATLAAGFTPTPGDWYNVAVTRTAGTYRFYVDGLQVGAVTNAIVIPDAAAFLTFGQAEGLGFFDGRLDEIQIYNRALTASEIEGLATVPEPVSLLLLAIGLAAVGVTGTRRGRTRRE
jgi:hypothetical protein